MIFQALKDTLDAQQLLPGYYLFKFIAPEEKQEAVRALFVPGQEVIARPSKHGRYVSLTASVYLQTSQEVIDVLAAVAQIPGVIAL